MEVMMMIALLNISELGGIWDAVIRIATPWSLAAFALVVVFLIVLKSRGKNVSPAIWIVILLLVAIPTSAWLYGRTINKTSIYRVRVIVVDPRGEPVIDEEGAEGVEVWSSPDAKPKKVKGGWQFVIPYDARPTGGKLVIYASKKSASLRGKTDLILADDFYPAIVVTLRPDDAATDDTAKVRDRNEVGT